MPTSTPRNGNCDLFYIPPQQDPSTTVNVTGPGIESRNISGGFDLPTSGFAHLTSESKNLPPVHLPNTLVPSFDWDPRTLEGVMTLVCPYPQAKEELFTIKDFGSLIVTYAETGPRGVFDEDLGLLITFSNIIRDKYYLRNLIGQDGEAVSLDISGRVVIT